MKIFLSNICIVFLFLLFMPHRAFADYVLPYPSFMPGSKIYAISRLLDLMKGYWYFGNLSKVKYHMNLSDKYLVEAKILFEYKQYLLAMDALDRSNHEFVKIETYLDMAKNEGKDVSRWRQLTQAEMNEHNLVLSHLTNILPEHFRWTPEKGNPTDLDIHARIDSAKVLRTRTL